MKRSLGWILISLMLIGSSVKAQNTDEELILFAWNDQLLAQAVVGGELTPIADIVPEQWVNLPALGQETFHWQQSPLSNPPIDNFGFQHGVWSSDKTQFAYLVIQELGAYQVRLLQAQTEQILITDTIRRERGYLDPVGWSADGTLLLIERHTLHHLNKLNVWGYNIASDQLSLIASPTIPNLKGNHVLLPSGAWVFIGFDTASRLGYLLSIETQQLLTFPTDFALPDPPPSALEAYPIMMLGSLRRSELDSLTFEDIPLQERNPTPFLFWMLPDAERSVTCYPDSAWTQANFTTTCPGLAVPRAYVGHEGTDVGGNPDGLAVGTSIFPASVGVVVDSLTSCESGDIPCGDSYGNWVLLEHVRVVNGNTEVWHTGYAHLQSVLWEQDDFVASLGSPLALSGDTGLGGAHLHFEVRALHERGVNRWVDPWDNRHSSTGESLWIGGNLYPTVINNAESLQPDIVCQTIDGNNIRSGAGLNFDILDTSRADTFYTVLQVTFIADGEATGEWYQVQWDEGIGEGWLWSGLMTDCQPQS